MPSATRRPQRDHLAPGTAVGTALTLSERGLPSPPPFSHDDAEPVPAPETAIVETEEPETFENEKPFAIETPLTLGEEDQDALTLEADVDHTVARADSARATAPFPGARTVGTQPIGAVGTGPACGSGRPGSQRGAIGASSGTSVTDVGRGRPGQVVSSGRSPSIR